MKSLMLLLQYMLHEMGMWCHIGTARDLKTITSRVEREGISFLTISLSNFGKDFEKSLDQGFVDHDQFKGFSKTGSLPRLFGGFFDLVFDRSDGRLLSSPSIDAIRSLRQITLMWGKIAIPCSDERTVAAIDGYIECEQTVRLFDATFDERKLDFKRVSDLLWSKMFREVDHKIEAGDILPKHGPGSTADRLFGNEKWNLSEWTTRLEAIFPHGEHLVSSWSLFLDFVDVDILEPGAERPVRVITVPKTLKTPRIIAVEPTCMQYMQQGILRCLVQAIEGDNHASNLIQFSSQIPNQVLAQKGSLFGDLATLDLSEASDRVSNQHVRAMLSGYPHFAEAVDATRSRKADVPGHGVKRLAKFASMGSALCFPFEALVFTTIIFLGIEKALNRRLTTRDITSLYGRVRVYGDDIIVPVEFVSLVVAELEAFGLKVNANKSFWTGKFRESCGKDYYDGDDVTVVKVRRLVPTQREQTDEIISIVSLRNQLYWAGYWSTCKWLDSLIEGFIPFPAGHSTSPGLVKASVLGYTAEHWSHHLQKPLVKAMVVTPQPTRSNLDGYGALNKFFHKDSDLPAADRNHLQFAGRPQAVDIKPRKVSPF